MCKTDAKRVTKVKLHNSVQEITQIYFFLNRLDHLQDIGDEDLAKSRF